MVVRSKHKAQTGLGLGASIALLGVFVLTAISLWSSTEIVRGQTPHSEKEIPFEPGMYKTNSIYIFKEPIMQSLI